ncbi:MAG: hypothetical protein ABR583_14830 [Gaiellaceae bacterium]
MKRAVALTSALAPHLHSDALSALGSALISTGDLVLAEATYLRELETCRAAGLLGPAATALMNLGWIALQRDQTAAASVAFSEALDLARKGGASTAQIESNLGVAALLDGSVELAEQYLTSALRDLAAMNARPAAAECLLGLAAIAAVSGEMERASILGAAWRAEHANQKTAPPPIHTRIEQRYLRGLERTPPSPAPSFEEIVEIALARAGGSSPTHAATH